MAAADDREKQQEQLRHALLAAADEEGAAIVEQARRDITLAVRRARRDLHLIRAQLHLCGVEVPPLPSLPSVEQGSLGEGVPQDAIVVGRTHALRHVVTEASLELEQLSASVGAQAPADDGLTEQPLAESSVSPVPRSRSPIVASGLVLVALGVAGWFYWRQDAQPAALTGPDSPRTAAAARPTPAPPAVLATPAETTAPAAAPPEVLPSRIVLRTVRPVWMRIEVDGRNDVGHEYPEGAIAEFIPSREVVIRAGDAGAVLVSIGKEPPTVMGRGGQVITRRITVSEPPPAKPGDARPPGAPAATIPANPPEAVGVTADQNGEILAKHQRWLEAFVRGDRQALRALTTEGFSLRDERTAPEIASRDGSAPQVSDVQIDVAGVGAVLTGRLRTVVDGVAHESQLSEVWVRNSQQQWALMGVRITPMAP